MPGRIPQSFIDDLLQRVDIVDVVSSRVTLKKTGKNYSGLCPFHQEKTPSFSVQPDKQFYYCFGCGASGNAIGFAMNYEKQDFLQAVEGLAQDMGLEVPRELSPLAQERQKRHLSLYQILEKSADFFQQQLRQAPRKSRAADYLARRGLSEQMAKDFGLGYAPPGWDNLLKAIGTDEDARKSLLASGMLIRNDKNPSHPLYDRFRDRLMFPIRDSRGRVIAFGGRVLGEDQPKYLNSPETPVFHKSSALYGLHEARGQMRQLERLLLVEGYMDVIALAQHGIPYAVATLGTAISAPHLSLLFKSAPEVIFCFDGDAAGGKAARRALEQALPFMEDGRSARFLFLPDGEDPDSQVRKIGGEEFIKAISQASHLSEFLLDSLRSEVDEKSMEGRSKLAALALPHIRTTPTGLYQNMLLDRLSEITGVDRRDFNLKTGGIGKAPSRGAASRNSGERPGQARGGLSACLKAAQLLLLQGDLATQSEIARQLEELKDLPAENYLGMDLLLRVSELANFQPDASAMELASQIDSPPLSSQARELLQREQITPADGRARELADILRNMLEAHGGRKSRQLEIDKARRKLNG